MVFTIYQSKKIYRLFIIITLVFMVVGIIIAQVITVSAAVDLRYFRAIAQNTKITIEWGTATELDHAGFYVLRSLSSTGTFQKISPFIYAQGDSLTGSDYEFDDQYVTPGNTYWYELESIDTSQNSSFSDPVSVGYQLPISTNTPTSTTTSTPTWTASPTIRSNVTQNPTNSPVPTSTLFPTTTDMVIQTTEPVVEEISTETFQVGPLLSETSEDSEPIPFPTITIQFPKQPALIVRTPFDGDRIKLQSVKDEPGITFSRYFIFLVLFGIWGILGYWIYHLTRNSK